MFDGGYFPDDARAYVDKTFGRPGHRRIAEAAHFETGKAFAVIRMNIDGSFDQTGLYEKKEAAFGQQTRQVDLGLDRGDLCYVYVVADYPNGRVVYLSRDTVLDEFQARPEEEASVPR